MNPIQEELTSERTLKKFLKESDYTFLNMLNDRISSTLADKKSEHDEQEKQRIERENKRMELMSLIEAEGFSLTDLIGSEAQVKSPKRKPKYEYIEGGVKKHWSGVGRTPRPIQNELDAGKPLDSFLIANQSS